MSLALSTLMYEWRRYLAAVIALAMAGVLMLALTGMFVGLLQSFTASIDRARGQLLVMPAAASSMQGQSSPLPARVIPLIYRHSGVAEVRDLPGDFGPFYGPGATKPSMVVVNGVDTEPDAITLPQDFTEEQRMALSAPFNVAVDRTALNQLKVKLGDEASLYGRTVRVAAILDNYPSVEAPMLFTSRATLRAMGRIDDSSVGALFVRVKDPSQALIVRDELNAIADGQYRVWDRKELSAATIRDVMQQGIIVILMSFMSSIGFIIGVVITWQTLRGAILANIKEFASLRALGVSIGSLRWVVMELSFWVGIAGVLVSGLCLMAISFAGRANNIPMAYPIPSVAQTIVLLLLIAVGSGMLTLGALKKGEPADLLK
ncbi:FtsX-like permease family protein [bacterium]|nr:FtsX-like permease family protein [bacterium]